jgi:molecular chaperone GrpE
MAAENQNTRKRLVKQQQDAYKYRHQDILRDLADVIDNFERAIESSADSRDFDTFHEGILMIEKQFSGMLTERYGLERIGVEGEAYDPSLHEAMMSEESPDVEEETVKQVFQAGYRLHDRILRPAKVVVAKPASRVSEKKEETENADAGDE